MAFGTGREEIKVDGKTFNIPSWATESTLRQLQTSIDVLAKEIKQQKNTEKNDNAELIKNFRDGTTDLDKTIEDFAIKTTKIIKDLGKDVGSAMMAAAAAAGEKLYSFTTSLLKTGATALFGALGFNIASIKDTFDELRMSFGELNKVGLNLAAGFGENLAMGTKDVMNEFMNMGLNMQELTGIMTSNSFAMAANRKTFVNTAKTFAQLSKSGVDYGLTVAENNQLLADELDFRSRMLFQNQVDAEEAAEQADELFTAQMGYTKLLGKSIDEIRKSAQDILKGSSSALSLIALQGEAGEKTLTGLTSFASGLVASGFTEDFAASLMEAGTGIDMFTSEATRGSFTVLSAAGVDIYGSLARFRNKVRNEELSASEAAVEVAKFRDQIAEMPRYGLEQLRMMAAAGDDQAAALIAMRNSVKQAKKSAEDLAKALPGSGDGEAIYRKMLAVDAAMAKVKGSLTQFRQSIALSFLPAIEFVSKVLSNPKILNALTIAGEKISDAIMGVQRKLGKVVEMTPEEAVEKLGKFIVRVSESIAKMITFIQKWTGEDEPAAEQESLLFRIGKGIGELVWGLLSGIWDLIAGAFKNFNFGSAFEFLAKGALGLTGIAVVLKLLGMPFALKGALVLGITAASIWAVSEAFATFDKLNWDNVWQGVAAIGVLLGVGGAIAGIAAGFTGLTGGLGALALAAGAGFLLAIAFSINLVGDALERISKIPKGALETLVPEIKSLAEALTEFGTAAFGGELKSFAGIFTDAKTPVGVLADDLEQLIKTAKTAPPAVASRLGMSQVNTQPGAAGTATQTTTGSMAAQAGLPTVTREQELLDGILTELKKSVSALNRIKEISINSAT